MSVAFVRVSLHRVRVSPTIKSKENDTHTLRYLRHRVHRSEVGPRPVFGDRLYRRSTQIKYTLPIKVHFTINGQWHHSTL